MSESVQSLMLQAYRSIFDKLDQWTELIAPFVGCEAAVFITMVAKLLAGGCTPDKMREYALGQQHELPLVGCERALLDRLVVALGERGHSAGQIADLFEEMTLLILVAPAPSLSN